MIRLINIFILFLIITKIQSQELNTDEVFSLELETIEKKSNDVIIATITEVSSNGEVIGIVNGDFDGISLIDICAKKIEKNQITLKVYGMKCTPFEKKYKIKDDLKIKIKLEYGNTLFQTLNDRRLVLSKINALNLNSSDIILDEKVYENKICN